MGHIYLLYSDKKQPLNAKELGIQGLFRFLFRKKRIISAIIY